MNELYKKHYWYHSGLNDTIKNDLKDIVKSATKLIKLKNRDVWLDVGANDGTLLSYVPDRLFTIGVEPASNMQKELKKNCDLAIPDFWEDTRFGHDDKIKVITAIGMFYDSEDPNYFMQNIKRYLHDDGIFVAQLMTLKQMIDNNDIGNICHEHLEYYDYKALVYLYESNGLEIFKVEENKINGGSYRLFARHYKNGSVKKKEKKVNYDKWKKTIQKNKEDAVQFIKEAVRHGVEVCVYGASTKGNTILQYYKLNNKHIVCAVDKSSEKIGKYTVGTNIPVVGNGWLYDCDYAFVMPYGFIDLFKKKEERWLENGGKFLVPFPKFKIIQ